MVTDQSNKKSKGLLAVMGINCRIRCMCLAVWFCRCVMVNKLIRVGVLLVMVICLCFAFYEVGKKVGASETKVQIVTQEKEVIRYVEKKKNTIQSKPNANRDELVRMFKSGIL